MPADLTADDRAALESVVSQLEAAWNAMDGPAFAAPFASDADFVTIRAEHFRGRLRSLPAMRAASAPSTREARTVAPSKESGCCVRRWP